MRASAWTWAAAALLALGSVALVVLGQPGRALPLGAAALAVMALGAPRGMPAESAQAGAEGAMRALQAAVEALALEGQAVYAPTRAGIRLFVPAAPGAPVLPPLDDGRLLYQDHREGNGLAGPSPAASLATLGDARIGAPQGAGAEEAALYIPRALRALGLARPGGVGRTSTGIRIRFRPVAFPDLPRLAQASPNGLGCPAVSFCLDRAAACLARPVRLASLEVAGGEVTLDMEVLHG